MLIQPILFCLGRCGPNDAVNAGGGTGSCNDDWDCPSCAPYCSTSGYCQETSQHGSYNPVDHPDPNYVDPCPNVACHGAGGYKRRNLWGGGGTGGYYHRRSAGQEGQQTVTKHGKPEASADDGTAKFVSDLISLVKRSSGGLPPSYLTRVGTGVYGRPRPFPSGYGGFRK